MMTRKMDAVVGGADNSMRRIVSLAVLLVASASLAQDGLPERLLITTGQYVGPGARAQGLGGAYTGVADDYSAIWWNPAGLAQIKRIEMQGSISRTGYSNDASYFGIAREGSTSSMRINDAGFVFPVPVYQGALSFALGYSQVNAFDRRTRTEANRAPWRDFDELEDGRLGFWSFAGAVDVSPNLALGMGLQYWSGFDDYSLTGYSLVRGSEGPVENTIETDLKSFGANFGGLFRAGRFARIGAVFQTPMSMKIEENYSFDGDGGYSNYRMTYPAVVRLGGSVSPGRWLAAADLEYRDWTSMEFRDETPYTDVSKAEANQQIKDDYRSTTRLNLGGEYLLPGYGSRARIGYSFAPSNYRNAGGDDDQSILTFGVGVLVDRSVMLDAAYHFTGYTEKTTEGLTEDIRSSAAVFSLSYRM